MCIYGLQMACLQMCGNSSPAPASVIAVGECPVSGPDSFGKGVAFISS